MHLELPQNGTYGTPFARVVGLVHGGLTGLAKLAKLAKLG